MGIIEKGDGLGQRETSWSRESTTSSSSPTPAVSEMAWWLWITVKFTGGDQRYLYRGFYKTDGQTVEADIQVSYYRGEAKSVLGHIAKFKLNLSGKSTNEAFTVSGHVFGQSQLAITIEGQKQADLLG